MMSSLASLFVAKANATPEKVVPCKKNRCLEKVVRRWSRIANKGQRSTDKVDADNQLGLAAAVALHLGRGVACIGSEWPRGLRRRWGRVASRAGVAWRTARHGRGRAASHDGRRVAGDRGRAGVDGRRTSNHLRRWSPGRALVGEGAGAADGAWRAGRVVGGVTGRSRTSARMIHWETWQRRVGCTRRDDTRAREVRGEQRRYLRGTRGRRGRRRRRALQQAEAGTGSRRGRLLRLRLRVLLLLLLLWLLLLDRSGRPPFTETKAFQARVQRTHRTWTVLRRGRERKRREAQGRGSGAWGLGPGAKRAGAGGGETEKEAVGGGGGGLGNPRKNELNRGRRGEN